MNSHNRSVKEFSAINGVVNEFSIFTTKLFQRDTKHSSVQLSCILLRRCASLQLKNANSVYDADLML